jgi:hypothetical protein
MGILGSTGGNFRRELGRDQIVAARDVSLPRVLREITKVTEYSNNNKIVTTIITIRTTRRRRT